MAWSTPIIPIKIGQWSHHHHHKRWGNGTPSAWLCNKSMKERAGLVPLDYQKVMVISQNVIVSSSELARWWEAFVWRRKNIGGHPLCVNPVNYIGKEEEGPKEWGIYELLPSSIVIILDESKKFSRKEWHCLSSKVSVLSRHRQQSMSNQIKITPLNQA